MRSDALTDAVRIAEGCGAKAKDVISKASVALAELYSHMFLQDALPKTL
jgi:hypothetical protein